MPEGILPDYSRQAQTYDQTRGASRSVVVALRGAIDGAPGYRLADIGGGTGNYKGLETLLADAAHLPLADRSFDAALMVSMLHHVDDPRAALNEAKRVLRPRGRLAVKMFRKEDVEGLWLYEYFPSSRPWMIETRPSVDEFLDLLPCAGLSRIRLTDLSDASMAALVGQPQLVLEERWRRQTSYFERLERDHPEELRSGLQRLADDITIGQSPKEGSGSATLIAWRKPG